MQCRARYKIYDKDGQLDATLYCSKDEGHDGSHENTFIWEDWESGEKQSWREDIYDHHR